MQWWARSRLRTKIFLAFSTLILVVLLLTLGFAQLVVSRQAQDTLRHELLTTGQVFRGLVAERATRGSRPILLCSLVILLLNEYSPPMIHRLLLQQRSITNNGLVSISCG